jgi:hypothetical protein
LNEQNRFIEADYPEIRSATFIAQDNNKEKPFDLELPYTTHPYRCSRIARITLFRSREQITIAGEFGMDMFGVEVGDTVSFTYDRYGWTNKTFEVSSWHYVAADNGELKIAVMLREISAAVFGSSVEDERTIIGNDTNLPDPNIAMIITGLAQTSTTRLERDGRVTCSANVSWNPVSNSYLRHYQVQWKRNIETVWNSTTTTNSTIELTGLSEDQLTNLRVRALSIYENHGPFATLDFTPTADLTPPSQPTLAATDPGYDNIVVRWVNPTQADFKHVEVYWNTVNDSAGSNLLGTTDGEQYIHPNLAIGVTRWYFLKSADFSGNKSAFTTGVSGTTTGVPTVALVGDIVADEVAAGAINTASFALGLTPVEIVDTPPATGNYKGRVVFYTVDNKLYRHTGSPSGAAGFTVATDGADIIADSITTGKIAAAAITTTELAAGAVNASKIAADEITADKIAANAVTAGKIATDAVTADKIAANAITSGKIAANAITAGKIAAGAINTTDLIVDGAVSRRVYARGAGFVTLTTTVQNIISKTFGAGAFVAFQGSVGDRSNPVLMNLDMDIDIGSGGSGWGTVSIQAAYNISGTWTNFLVQNFRVPLDSNGIFPYTKSFVIDSGAWATVQAVRIQMSKSATATVIDVSGDYMLQQISV